MNIIKIKEGQFLFREGDASNNMYYLQTGHLKIVKKMSHTTDNIEIGEIIPGELVGELSFLDKEARSASVVAASDSEVIEISADLYDKLFRNQPKIVTLIIEGLVKRLRKSIEI